MRVQCDSSSPLPLLAVLFQEVVAMLTSQAGVPPVVLRSSGVEPMRPLIVMLFISILLLLSVELFIQ